MTSVVSVSILATYYLVLGILAFYGVHRLVLLALYYWNRGRAPQAPADPEVWPRVTVQLPIFNEVYVAERLIDAVCALDYPRDRLEIQVLDDSTDETIGRAAAVIDRWRQAGVDIHHLRRNDRVGFKAGALAFGLESARGELIAVFDADFVPEPDFLRLSVPWFDDPEIGMVQSRWEHINRDFSLLTRIQAIFLDGHFIIEHTARNWSGCFFNFNGTAGVWRRQTILDAGSWEHDTLTEDLDLSYRAQLAGWKFRFLPQVTAPAELPVEINAFKRQQFRWAKGSIQTARKLLPRLWRASLPWHVKLEAFVHLTNNMAYLLMVFLALLIFPAMYLRLGTSTETLLFVDLPLFLAATVSVLLFYVASQIERGGAWKRELLCLPALMALGMGLAVNNARAVIEGAWQDGGVFERTPKYRIENASDDWARKQYQASRSDSFAIEGVLALFFTLCFPMAGVLGMWLSLPFLYLFLQGYWTIFLLSLGSEVRRRRAVPAAALAPRLHV